MRKSRGSEAADAVFCLQAKRSLHTGVRTGCRCLSVCLPVCLLICMCTIRRCYRLRELYEDGFYKPGIYQSGRVWAKACDAFRRTASRGGFARGALVDFVGYFGCDRLSCFLFPFLVPSNAHGLRQL